MPIASGTRLGHYEILSRLGSGGMGAVYKARDTRLERTVAIKVMKEPSPALRERFEREARVVAALQHPHICTLYDIGSHEDTDFLVMEYLEGRTLQCPQPLDKALEYGIQIAGALEAAHGKGVTHRDLKPSNIMITRTGVKVLDFGLARRSGEETLTAAGTVMGTPAYMTPEQWQGKEADARTDLHALGSMIYEMVTGRRAAAERQKLEPARLDWAVKACLETEPEERWQTARDLRRELEAIREASTQEAAPRQRYRLWLAATVLLTAAVALAVWLAKPAPSRTHLQVSISAPPKTWFLPALTGEGGIALSPDGTLLAFSARIEGTMQLWVRRLDSSEALALPGTEGAYYPFWSPDSRSIGFFTQNKLKRVELSGGPAQILCDIQNGRGGTWNQEGVIVFSAVSPGRALHRVPAAGGTPVAVTRLDQARGENAHRWPQFLPDGKRFLYMSRTDQPENTGIWVASLDAPRKPRWIVAANSNATYLPSRSSWWARGNGHVFFVREHTLMAQAVDGDLAPAGEAFRVVESVAYSPTSSCSDYSVATNGMLVYSSAAGRRVRLVWRDRGGKEMGGLGGDADYRTPGLSPDGKRVAFARMDAGNLDLWIAELAGNTATRFTFDPGLDLNPVWSPDGASIAFTGDASVGLNIYRKSSSGAGNPERLTNAPLFQFAQDWSGDGRFLLFSEQAKQTGYDLMVQPLVAGGKPFAFLQTKFQEMHGSFSPGAPRWIAYSSDESGLREVYVQGFTSGQPASGARWQVSTGGGSEPRWRSDGKELYYLSLDRKMMAASVRADGPAFQHSAPRVLFASIAMVSALALWTYDVTGDGSRFLLAELAAEVENQPLTLVTNWQAAAKR